MNAIKKIAAAVAVAIGSAGSGVVQSDIVDFGYGVSSATVTTILSVATTEVEPLGNFDEPETLHFSYLYKSGANATSNGAECEEVDFTFESSPDDLVTVSPDGTFGQGTRGIMFKDPTVFANYDPYNRSLALLEGITKPIRFVTFVDNNDGSVAADDTLTAARATIIEHISGHAWGYRGYNPRGNSFTGQETRRSRYPWDSFGDSFGNSYSGSWANSYGQAAGGFSEKFEVFGEVIGPGDGPNPNGRGEDGVVMSIKPFDEFASLFFVQPIAHLGNTDSEGRQVDADQRRKNLEAMVTISVSDYTDRPGDAMFDRDENPVSSNTPQLITCVGAVTIQDLLSQGAELLLQDTGGWGEFKTVPITRANTGYGYRYRYRYGSSPGTRAGAGRVRTEQVVAHFLEHNDIAGTGAGGTVDGENVGGVIANGFALRED